MSYTKYFIKIKNALQNITVNFVVSKVFYNNVIFNVLLMIT
jgi:hypothetical protein